MATKDLGDKLEWNLGRLPLLETPAGAIGQMVAINFYVATECGMMGSNPLEAAQILALQEHIKEMQMAYLKLIPYGSEPTTEKLDEFFLPSDAQDYSGPADPSKMAARRADWFVARIEALVGNKFAVGDKISLADVLLYNLFED